MDQLTDNEKQLLAREVAADCFSVTDSLIEVQCEECGLRDSVEGVRIASIREAVKHGWDAAMEYVNARLQQSQDTNRS